MVVFLLSGFLSVCGILESCHKSYTRLIVAGLLSGGLACCTLYVWEEIQVWLSSVNAFHAICLNLLYNRLLFQKTPKNKWLNFSPKIALARTGTIPQPTYCRKLLLKMCILLIVCQETSPHSCSLTHAHTHTSRLDNSMWPARYDTVRQRYVILAFVILAVI